MRSGVVLLITLSLLIALSLAIVSSTSVTEKYLSSVTKSAFLTQLNRSFLDMENLLKKATSEVNDAESLSILTKIPILFSEQGGEFHVQLSLESNAQKFNINQLLDQNGTINRQFYDLLYFILLKYQVIDPTSFLDLVLDTIDVDDEPRAYNTEIAHQITSNFTDGKIKNKEIFEEILANYSINYEDHNVFAIPWNEIVQFEGENVDFNFLTPTLKEILSENNGIIFPHDEDTVVKNDKSLHLNDEQKKFFKDMKINFYEPVLACRFAFNYRDKSQNIDFVYKLENKRITNIETIF